MPIVDGQLVNAAVTNAAFLYKNSDDTSTGSYTFGNLTISKALAFIQLTPTTVTNQGYIQITNAGANNIFGAENSAGGSLFSGSSAYATVIGNDAARSLHFATNNVVRVTISSTGNVGFGIAPSATAGTLLNLSTANSGLIKLATTASTNNEAYINFANTTGDTYFGREDSDGGNILSGSSAYATVMVTNSAHSLQFGTNNAVRASILSTGEFDIGVTGTAPNVSHKLQNNSTTLDTFVITNDDTTTSSNAINAVTIVKGSTTNTTAQKFILFSINAGGTASGEIAANGANTAAFQVTSDRRIKENIEDLPSQLYNILKLRPVEFDYKNYEFGNPHQIGFIAQEMQNVYPDVISENEKTGMLSITGWDKTSARIVKAIQELAERVLLLENK